MTAQGLSSWPRSCAWSIHVRSACSGPPDLGGYYLLRPQPSEGAGREERVHQAVEHGFERRAPRALEPDRVLQERQAVASEGCAADEPEDFEVVGARLQGSAGDVGGEDANDDRVEEPQDEVVGYRRHSACDRRYERHRSLLHL